MAKNRKKKGADSSAAAVSTSSSPGSSEAPAASSASRVTDKAVDAAFAAGNYSAIRELANGNNDEAKKLMPKTVVDMGQVAVGFLAMAVVLTVAFFVLHAR